MCSYLGSEVSSMDNFINSWMSTEESITEVCAWQPRRFGSCSRAARAFSLLAALIDRAIRVSSVCSLGFLLPRYWVFRVWIGSMAWGEIRCESWSMPARAFRAFSSRAAEGPSRSEVFPCTILPSCSSKAAAGAPVFSSKPDWLSRQRGLPRRHVPDSSKVRFSGFLLLDKCLGPGHSDFCNNGE